MQNAKFLSLIAGAFLLVACGHPKATTEGAHEGNVLAITDSTLLTGTADTLRFGRMRAGEIARQTLWIENRGTKPLVILRYDRSCGCASLDFSNRPLKPGEAQQLSVTFNSSGEWGLIFKKLDITFADARQPLHLYVEATVDNP